MNDLPAPTRRLFIGLFPDPGVQAAIAAHRASWSWPPGARLTNVARIHMTLHFLGEVEAGREALLSRLLCEVPVHRMSLRLGTPQTWRQQIAVLRTQPHAGLDALHEAIARQVARAGFSIANERERWLPHLTIARRTRGAVPPADPAPIVWRVDHFALVCSHLRPLPHYEAIARYPAPG